MNAMTEKVIHHRTSAASRLLQRIVHYFDCIVGSGNRPLDCSRGTRCLSHFGVRTDMRLVLKRSSRGEGSVTLFVQPVAGLAR